MSIDIKDGMYMSVSVVVEISPDAAGGSGVMEDNDGTEREYRGINWMGMLYRDVDQPEGYWTIKSRFRYIVDDKVFGSDDIRSWMEASNSKPMDEDDAREMIMSVANLLQRTAGGKEYAPIEIIEIHGGPEAFEKALKEQKTKSMHVSKGYKAEKPEDLPEGWQEEAEADRLRKEAMREQSTNNRYN